MTRPSSEWAAARRSARAYGMGMTLLGRLKRSPVVQPSPAAMWFAAGLGLMSLLLARASLRMGGA